MGLKSKVCLLVNICLHNVQRLIVYNHWVFYIVNGEASSSASAGMEDSLFGALKDLFIKINGQKKRSGVVAPHQFVAKLKSSHGMSVVFIAVVKILLLI